MAKKIDRNETIEVRHDGYHWPEFIYVPLASIIEIYYDECHRSCEEDMCDCSIDVKYHVPPFGPLRQRHELDGDGKPFKPDMSPIRTGRSDRADLRAARAAVAARKKRTKH